MTKNMWKRAAAIGMTLGMLVNNMPISAYADEMIVEDDSYIVVEDDTEVTLESEAYEDPELFDDTIIYEDEPKVEDESVLGIDSEETEAELYAAEDEEDIPIDETHFPDDNFRAVISTTYYDIDQNGYLSSEEIALVWTLSLEKKSIKSLEGIRYFKNLQELNCGENQLKSLDVSGLSSLRFLKCWQNPQMTSLNIHGCTSLTLLNCFANNLTSLDARDCVSLQDILCGSNRLTQLFLNCQDTLKALGCGGNSLTSLDLRGYSKLNYLDIYYNKFSSLDLTDCSNLVFLEAHENESLTSLDVSPCILLETLICDGNGLTSLDISHNTQLQRLECGHNKLSNLDVSSCSQLGRLRCEANQISTLDISNCPKLKDIYNNGDQFTEDGKVIYGTLNEIEELEGDGLQIDSSVSIITTNGSFTVMYDANGGSGAPSAQTKKENVALTLSSIQPTKSCVLSYNANGGSVSPASKTLSSTFKNWNTAQNGSGTSYNPGASYTANAAATLYAQWTDPQAGTLPTPTRNGYEFAGWYTSVTGGTQYTETTTVTGNTTLYAHWGEPVNIYNLGDETYSFENYGDSDSWGGHCFGMSITSSAYYNHLLDIGIIGGNENTPLYSFMDTDTVRKPICKYQNKQGSYRDRAIVAGGSWLLDWYYDISSDWSAVVNYVKNHNYDNTGVLQIVFWKRNEGGHAINLLRYENVNGQDRIYAYDNNFPNQETYFYKDASGQIQQTPEQTFSGAIDCIGLLDVRSYMNIVSGFDATHVLYMQENDAYVQGYTYTYVLADSSNDQYVMYEIPENQDRVMIIPKEDNATFVYMDEEYSFGKVNDATFGVLKLASNDVTGTSDENFIKYNEVTETTVTPEPTPIVSGQPATITEMITITKKPTNKKPSVSGNKITVNWKHFKQNKKTKPIWKNIKKVQVQCATDSAFTNIVKSTMVGKKKTKTTIKGLAKKTTYYVRVRYYDGTGYSAWSGVKKVKTK